MIWAFITGLEIGLFCFGIYTPFFIAARIKNAISHKEIRERQILLYDNRTRIGGINNGENR